MSEEQELFCYAYERFENGEYDKALDAFVLAYTKGYEQELILKNIYDCYMSGNENEFRLTYEQWKFDQQVSYEDCVLDFVPYRDGEYIIFDKEKKVFQGVFSVIALQEAEPDEAFQEIEFSPAALVANWDWREEMPILTTAIERNVYMVCQDARRCFSFCKIPELKIFLEHLKIFNDFSGFQQYLHENTSVYLPMAIYGDENERAELFRIRTEEHQYRLSPQGRNSENVLLTIAIPTAHRGNLLLKRLEKLLKLPYDAEIEIAVSKNGNELFEEEYRQASEIQDARLRYRDCGKLLECGYHNWHNVVEMSHGKFVLVISDEDDIIIEALEHYLKLLSSNPDLCVVRPKSTKMYDLIKTREYGKRGWEAFGVVFLSQNHFPGLIVNREKFIEANLLDLDKYSENYYYKYYPHEWWCLKLSQLGDCMKEPVALNDDSHPVDRDKEWEALGKRYVPGWKSYESRIKQFEGEYELLQKILKIDNKIIFENLLCRMMDKTALLLEVTRKDDEGSASFLKAVEQFASISIHVIQESFLDDIQKERTLKFLQLCCEDCFKYNIELKKKVSNKV